MDLLGTATQTPPFGAAAGLYLAGDDHLRITSFNSAAGVRLSVQTRQLLAEGRVVAGGDFHTPNTDRTTAFTLLTMAEGWLQGVSVFAAAGTPRDGQCFVLVEVVRGRTGAVVPLGLLLSGYVTDTQPLAWPGTLIRRSAEGAGVIRSITGTDPAAGVEVSETVPTNARWRVLGVDVALVTDITAPVREVVLTIDDGAALVAEIAAGTSQAASLTRRYSFARGVQRGGPAASTIINAPIPDAILMGGYRVRTVTTALVAGDNFGAPQLWVEEWIED